MVFAAFCHFFSKYILIYLCMQSNMAEYLHKKFVLDISSFTNGRQISRLVRPHIKEWITLNYLKPTCFCHERMVSSRYKLNKIGERQHLCRNPWFVGISLWLKILWTVTLDPAYKLLVTSVYCESIPFYTKCFHNCCLSTFVNDVT